MIFIVPIKSIKRFLSFFFFFLSVVSNLKAFLVFICRNLNDDSPLGLRRILSQSTDSLNFRNRAMSMESLNDDGEAENQYGGLSGYIITSLSCGS